MSTTIVIPVSRLDFLERVYAGLELMTAPKDTNLLTIVDGDKDLYVRARNLTESSKFKERLCVQYSTKLKISRTSQSIRRTRIAEIKNFSKDFIKDVDFVFSTEDDTVVPPHALSRLLKNYDAYGYAGMIQGVQIGRWGMSYVGAWKFDDIYRPTKLSSLLPSQGITEVDAGGFYCYLTKAENYLAHIYEPFAQNAMGPDVNYGLWLRREGFKNYTDWSIKCGHFNKDGLLIDFNSTKPREVKMELRQGRWRFTHV